MKQPAVILFSGGLDSTTCLALAREKGFACHALSFNYAQRHNVELQAATKIAAAWNIPHKIVNLPADTFSGSALTDDHVAVSDYQNDGKIPLTYVPARNTVFLAIALGWAEVLQANDIFIGSSFVDYSGYPDCRPEYFAAFQTLANLATKAGVEGNPCAIHTPLLYLSKAETIELGISLGVDYGMTVSCYQADDRGAACGRCDSCYLRKKGFQDAGVDDPTRYS